MNRVSASTRPAAPTADPDAVLVTSPEVFGTTLLVWALDRIGPELIDPQDGTDPLDPAAVAAEIVDVLGRPLPPRLFDRLMAALHVVTTDSFHTSVPDFIELANVLSGSPFDPTEFDPADAEECAWAVTEVALLAPPEPGEDFLSEEVLGYIGHALKAEGFLVAPRCLSDADKYLKEASDQTAAAAADDPTTFAAAWQKRRERADALDAQVGDGVQRLLAQLESLHLKNGDTKNLIDRLEKQLHRG